MENEKEKLDNIAETAEVAEAAADTAQKTVDAVEKAADTIEDAAAKATDTVEDTTAKAADTAEDVITEAVDTAAETTEETADAAAEEVTEALPKKKGHRSSRIFINKNNMEWISTCAFCAFILQLGYAFGIAAHAGYTKGALLSQVLGDIYTFVFLIAFALFGIFSLTLAKWHSTLWLAIPAAVLLGATGYEVFVYGVTTFALVSYMPFANVLMSYASYVIFAVLYLLQFVAIILFILYLFKRIPKLANIIITVLCFLGFIACAAITLPGHNLNQNAPTLMAIFSFLSIALVLLLPVFTGKRVAVEDLAGLYSAEYDEKATGGTPDDAVVSVDAVEAVVEAAQTDSEAAAVTAEATATDVEPPVSEEITEE